MPPCLRRQQFGWILIPFVVACGHASEDSSSTRSSAISGGELAPDDSGVVLAIDVQNFNICSGALIAPNLVLTSRQCMAKLGFSGVDCATSTFAPAASPSTIAVVADASWQGGDTSKLRKVSEIHVPTSTNKI